MKVARADTKRRVVIPGAEPGDVFDIRQEGEGRYILVRLQRPPATPRMTRQEVRDAMARFAADPHHVVGGATELDARTMILLDTNVLIYAAEPTSSLGAWARQLIEDAVLGEGAAANAICLAEVCAGDGRPETVADRIRDWGVTILDVPAAAAETCAAAHRRYLERRRQKL